MNQWINQSTHKSIKFLNFYQSSSGQKYNDACIFTVMFIHIAESKFLPKYYRYTAISIKVVHEQSGKVEYERELKAAGNRYENSLIC